MAHNSTYSEDTGYVDIHGEDIRVLVCNKTGSIAIPVDELKGMGFRLYRKSQYNRLLIDDNQFEKEFYLYMLECAQTYMLQKRTVFKENDILENINKCKAALTVNQNSHTSPRTPNNFVNNHVVEKSSDSLTITANTRETSPTIRHNVHNDSKFRGFAQSRSPTSSKYGEKFSPEPVQSSSGGFNSKFNKIDRSERNFFGKDNHFENSRFRNDHGYDQGRSEARNSIERNNAFGSRESFNKIVEDEQKNRKNSESSEEPQKRLDTIELNKSEHNVLISFVEKPNCLWVQDVDRVEALLEIDSQVKKDIAKNQKPTRIIWNQIYLAMLPEDKMWYRCRPIKFKPLTVFFVDYGNTSEVSEVREASESLSNIPCQAVRITFSETKYTPQIYDNITIRIKKRFDNGTYLVEVKTNSEPSSNIESPKVPTVPTFFRKPEQLSQLQNGQRVMLINHSNGKFALRTKECYDKLQQIQRALEKEEAKMKPVDKVAEGQLVLCKREMLQRAVVTNVQKSKIELELLDYCDKVKVDLSSLMHINEDLAKQQLTYILTPEIKGYNEGAEQLLRQLCEKKTRGTVILSPNGDFDIQLADELLSNKLKPRFVGPVLKDFKTYNPPIGSGNYMLNVYEDKDHIYFASEEALAEHLECVMKSELDDDNPYEPVVDEVCLGLYQDSWSRCVVLEAANRNYKVRFVDFGNVEILKSNDLRKLTEDGKMAPILAFCCQLTGLPSNRNMADRLKQYLQEGNNYDIKIKKYNGVAYEIEIPSVLEVL